MRERYRTILIQWRYQAELSAMGHEIHSSGIVIHPDGTVTHYISGDLKPEVRAKIEAKMKAEDEEKAKRKRRYQELSKEAAEKRKLEMELAYKRQNMTELLAKQAVDTSRGTYTTTPEAMASAVAAYENNMMLGSKGLLPPSDTGLLRILCSCNPQKHSKSALIGLLFHVFGGSQVQKSSCKQACIGFLNLGPWYHNIMGATGILQ